MMFLQLALYSLFISIIWAAPRGFWDGKIVGGVTVNIEEYPYQVSLQLVNVHVCGGSIISPNYVITAAHCIVNHPTMYNVRAGSSYHASGGQFIPVKWITLHTEFHSMPNNDIAVVELGKELVFGLGVAAIDLPSLNQEAVAGSRGVVTGWGVVDQQNRTSAQLQAVIVPVVERSTCASIYSNLNIGITESMFCAGYENGGKDACQGDSGGPFAINGQLVGIVSFGEGCATNYPSVYTSVAHFREFIREYTGI